MLRPIVCCCLALVVAAQDAPQPQPQPQPQPPLLATSGLPAGAAESALPAGAVLHVRLGHPATTLDALDALVVSFMPKLALPPDLAALRAQPKPLLAWLGTQTIGQPLTPERITALTGVALDRPATLSFYAANPATGWALALPYADARALTDALTNVFAPRVFERLAIGGKPGWHVVGTNPSLPGQCWILCSADTAYLFGSAATAARAAAANGPRLAADPLIADQLGEADDLVVALSPAAIKPLIGMFAMQIESISPATLAHLRAQLLANVDPRALAQIDRILRWNLGIPGHDFALDVAECALTATTSTVVPALATIVKGFDGVAAGIAIGGERQRLRLSVRAAAIAADGFAAALPLDEIRAAIAALPGDRDWVAAHGREPQPTASALAGAWADRFVEGLTAKGLPTTIAVAFARDVHDAAPAASLASSAAWTVQAAYAPWPPAEPATSLREYMLRLRQVGEVLPVTVFPALRDGDVVDLFAKRAAVENAAYERSFAFVALVTGETPWLSTEARFHADPQPGKPTRLVYDTVYRTDGGLFGYSQHELINRMAWELGAIGGFQALQPMRGSRPTWLAGPAPTAAPVPAALSALIDQVPAGADDVQTLRLLPLAPRLVAELGAFEGTLRNEIDAYLAACVAVVRQNTSDDAAVATALARVPMPVQVASLNRTAGGTLYVVLPGGLRYPRPAVVPLVAKIVAEAATASDDVGGLVAWTTVGAGRLDTVVVDDTRGIARFLTTAIDAAWRDHLATPERQAALRAALAAPGDGDPAPQEAIVRNAMWDAMQRPARRGPGRAAAPPPDSPEDRF